VRRRQVTRSAVSGKSLAKAPAGPSMARTPARSPRGPRPPATGTSGALLSSDDLRVQCRASGDASSAMAWV
jgi:hypothetical protein